MNWQQEDNPGQLSLNQHLNFRSKLTNERKLLISGAFIHDLGVQYFFDSIARFYPDGNTLDIKMEVKSGRRLSIFISSRFATRLFNGYDIESDQSGGNQRILNSSFMTPLVCNFAAGLSLNNKWMGSLNMGITGAKLTYIRNKEIYSSLNVDEFFGVAKGKNFKFEYGLSLQILIDRDIFKSVHWNCDLMVFKNFNKPVELSLKNQIGVRISRFIKGMVQTRLQYNDEVSLHLQLENTVTAGFFIKW
jgi:hypothetical protein